MAKKRMISEILEEASKQDSQVSRGQYLKDNYSVALITILKGGFDDSVVWNLPEGTPPYTQDDAPKGFEYSSLHKQSRKLGKYFIKGGMGEALAPVRRESMFIEMLESLHSTEAELVIAMKEGLTGRYKGITLKLVQDTFPDLIKTVAKASPVVEETAKVKKKPKSKKKNA